jgi:DNA modification methylase
MFVEHLCQIFSEVKRATKDTGSLWIVIKDSYGKNKSLLGVPDMLKLKLIQQGWICRNDIIWRKTNSMPVAINDRFTDNYERIFFFVKTKNYYFDQQFEPINPESLKRSYHPINSQKAQADERQVIAKQRQSLSKNIGNGYNMNMKAVWDMATESWGGKHYAIFPTWLVERPLKATCPTEICNICGHVTIKRYSFRKAKLRKRKDGEIYIDFLEEFDKKKDKLTQKEIDEGIRLVRSHNGYINCDCKPNVSRGIALDPFFGRGTVGKVASQLGMDFVGIELNKRYVKMAWDYIALSEKLSQFL